MIIDNTMPPEQTAEDIQSETNQDSFDSSAWINCLVIVAQHYGIPVSLERVHQAAQVDLGGKAPSRIRNIARNLGLKTTFIAAEKFQPSSWHVPFLLRLKTGEIAVVKTISTGAQASITFNGGDGLERAFPLRDLLEASEIIVIARPARTIPDARVDDYIKPFEENWLRKIALHDLGSYGHVLIASLIANILALAGIIFSMQVYDRVIPAQSINTLYVLFSGVLLALVFDFIMHRTRMNISDLLGNRTDKKMSDVVFGHALRIRTRARPQSTGSFIAQLRDLEQVREMLTSTTVMAIVDLPFIAVFLVIYWFIAGKLILIPIGAMFLMVLPGLFYQRRLRLYANQAMRESSLRNAMLVESVQGIEDIKTLQMEDHFQKQWSHYNEVTGDAQLRLRSLTNGLNTWTNKIQTGVYAATVFVGAPMVIAGDLTTGVLVGASILGSRMMAPLSQISAVMNRVQHAKIAKQGLDDLMKMPVDHPDNETRIHCERIEGRYNFKNAMFRYGDNSSAPVLFVRNLSIEPGEKIALLGKNGAGKSTLLMALSGLLDATDGETLVDNLSIQHIDPADLRRDIGLLSQNATLFFGTIRENITMGARHASDEEIQNILSMVGADSFVRKLPEGLQHTIQEGGKGLSGGQKQALLLARLLIREPSVILLDEPTAMMDEATERHFIEAFSQWSAGRTVVIATHRMRVLDLVNRLIVVENGAIALDENKEDGLLALRGVRKLATPARGKAQTVAGSKGYQ